MLCLPSPLILLCTSHTRLRLFSKFTTNFQTTQWLWWLFHWFEHASSSFLLTFLLCWVKCNFPLPVSKVWIKAFSLLHPQSTLSASLLEHVAYLPCIIIRSIHVYQLQEKSMSLKGLHPKIVASSVYLKQHPEHSRYSISVSCVVKIGNSGSTTTNTSIKKKKDYSQRN